MDLIITKSIEVKELIKALQDNFFPDDVVTTGLWIRKNKKK